MNPTDASHPSSDGTIADGVYHRPWREWELWAVVLLVSAIYCCRLTTLPICGEESRWAGSAREMIASGDWIVPRQQGQVFAERPPLGTWAMAAVGLLRGQVDTVAVRLPSALATVLLAAVIYLYGRIFLARRGALCAALAYATLGQVLQIGRLGESEALFSLLLAAALLAWHAGYVRHWPAALTWSLGYTLAALAALVKGPQAPVYFLAVTGVLLAGRRQWRWLFGWQHALGLSLFVGLIALWQIPFWRATDWQTVVDVWSGLARDRFSFAGLLKHLVSYPLETIGCLLPWSPLLIALVDPRFRRGWGAYRELMTFVITALLVTYPTVWLSAGARGRYYMPLYPCFALLIGIVVERCTATDAALELRRGWRRYLLAVGVFSALAAVAVGIFSGFEFRPFALLRQPPGPAIAFVLISAAAALVLLGTAFGRLGPRPRLTLLTVAAVCGASQVILFTGIKARGQNDIAPDVAALRGQLPAAGNLVSFGPIAHRFAYYYGQPIQELPWPTDPDQAPTGVEYFCFEHHQSDTDEQRQNGRGRTWATTPGGLPFRWERVAWIPCDPGRRENPVISVIVGRILRPGEDGESSTAAGTVKGDVRR